MKRLLLALPLLVLLGAGPWPDAGGGGSGPGTGDNTHQFGGFVDPNGNVACTNLGKDRFWSVGGGTSTRGEWICTAPGDAANATWQLSSDGIEHIFDDGDPNTLGKTCRLFGDRYLDVGVGAENEWYCENPVGDSWKRIASDVRHQTHTTDPNLAPAGASCANPFQDRYVWQINASQQRDYVCEIAGVPGTAVWNELASPLHAADHITPTGADTIPVVDGFFSGVAPPFDVSNSNYLAAAPGASQPAIWSNPRANAMQFVPVGTSGDDQCAAINLTCNVDHVYRYERATALAQNAVVSQDFAVTVAIQLLDVGWGEGFDQTGEFALVAPNNDSIEYIPDVNLGDIAAKVECGLAGTRATGTANIQVTLRIGRGIAGADPLITSGVGVPQTVDTNRNGEIFSVGASFITTSGALLSSGDTWGILLSADAAFEMDDYVTSCSVVRIGATESNCLDVATPRSAQCSLPVVLDP